MLASPRPGLGRRPGLRWNQPSFRALQWVGPRGGGVAGGISGIAADRRAMWAIAAFAAGVGWLCASQGLAATTTPTVEQLQELSIEQLADVEVTSVSKQPEMVLDAPAPIY